MDSENKIKPILQQDFPELLGDPKINIPHSDATMDAHDTMNGEMLEKENGTDNTLLG